MGRYDDDEHTDYNGNGLGMRVAYYILIFSLSTLCLLFTIAYVKENF